MKMQIVYLILILLLVGGAIFMYYNQGVKQSFKRTTRGNSKFEPRPFWPTQTKQCKTSDDCALFNPNSYFTYCCDGAYCQPNPGNLECPMY